MEFEHTAIDRPVIIGYEPSLGDDALALGRRLAEVLGAPAAVATVFRIPRDMVGIDDLQQALDADSRSGFALARERLPGLELETHALADRSVAEGLHRLAEERRARLIAVGSSHRGRSGRLGFGNVVESLVRGAPCAVAVAPREYGAREAGPLARMAVAFDGSAESWAALETGIGLAERTGAGLCVLTVAEPPRYGYASAWSALSTGEIRDFEREAKERMLALAARRMPADLDAETRLIGGDPGSVLADASGDFDLLVVGSRGYGPLRRTLLGNSTRELMRRGRCPVMVLPRGASIDPLGARPQEGRADGEPAPV